MTKKEKMFKLIASAVKDLQKRGGISEDAATGKILSGLRACADESVMDLTLLPLLLQSIVEMELDLI